MDHSPVVAAKQDSRGEIEQWGQTVMEGTNKNGPYVDEEAPKKAVTDAVTKCLSYLGFGGDVHMGLFDDSKYVESVKKAQTAKARNAEYDDFKAKIEQAETVEQLTQLWKENKSLREMFHSLDEHYTDDLTQAASSRRAVIAERDRLVASHGPGFAETN